MVRETMEQPDGSTTALSKAETLSGDVTLGQALR